MPSGSELGNTYNVGDTLLNQNQTQSHVYPTPRPGGNTIKMPTFTPESPDVFFMLVEATLKQLGITDPQQIF